MKVNHFLVMVVLFQMFSVMGHADETLLGNSGVLTERLSDTVLPGQGGVVTLVEKCDLLPRLIQPGESTSGLSIFPGENNVSEYPDPDARWREEGVGEVLVSQPEKARIESLSEVLRRCPKITKQIVWVNGKGEKNAFAKWSNAQIARFDDLFAQLYIRKKKLDMACTDAKSATSTVSNTRGYVFYTEKEAFDIYAAHVAHVLYVEAMGLVPWSIFYHPDKELSEMLSSDRYFRHLEITPEYQSNAANYYPANIKPGRDFIRLYEQNNADYILVCDPRDGYEYLNEHSLIGKTQSETLANISLFFKENVFHADRAYGSHLKQSKNKTLATRLLRDPSGGIPVAGCHGAADTFRDLARSINIPLIRLRTPEVGAHKQIQKNPFPLVSLSHGSLCWRWASKQARCITHMDDIYAISTLVEAYFPIDGAGQKLTREQMAMSLFTNNWLAKADMRKRGFDYRIETVSKGSKWGKYTEGSKMFPDFGKIQGSWEHGNQAIQFDRTSVRNSNNRFPSNPHGADIQQKHHARLYYDLGIYNYKFLQGFCNCYKSAKGMRDQCVKQNEGLKAFWINGYKNTLQGCKAHARSTASSSGIFDQTRYDRLEADCENTYRSYVAGAEKEIKEVRNPKCESGYKAACPASSTFKQINDVLLTKKTGASYSYLPSIDDYRVRALDITNAYGSCDKLEKASNDESKKISNARKAAYRKEQQP